MPAIILPLPNCLCAVAVPTPHAWYQNSVPAATTTTATLQVELAATQEALVCSQSQAAAAVAQYGALEQACMQAAPVVTQLLQDYDGMAAEALLLSSSNSRLVDTNMEVTAERDEALQGLQLLAECCVAQNAELTRCKVREVQNNTRVWCCD